MIVRWCSLSKWVLPAVLGLAGTALLPTPTLARQAGSSSGANGGSLTNINSLRPRKDSLLELERRLSGAFRDLNPKGSLDGMMAPPSPTVAPPPSTIRRDPQAEEKQDLRRNWIFMKPEDLLQGQSAEEMFNVPEYDSDGQKKKKLSALDRFFESMNSKSARNDKDKDGTQGKDRDPFASLDGRKATGKDITLDDKEARLPTGVKASAEALRKLVNSDTEISPFSGSSLRGVLAEDPKLGPRTLSDRLRAPANPWVQEYKSMLQTMAGPPNKTVDLANSLANKTGKVAGYNPGMDAMLPARDSLARQVGVVSGQLNPTPLPDLNAKALNEWNPMYVEPKAEPARRVAPPTLSFDAPRRKF